MKNGSPKEALAWDVEAYRRRLRLLREIISGESQVEFSKRLGIPVKRWNNYERGYPVPRETAFLLKELFPGISIEWVWWGWTGNLSKHYAERIAAAEQHERALLEAQKALDAAQRKFEDTASKRKAAIHPPKRPPRKR